LAIPPAWTDVWVCADPQGHLQAVGRDARGRKQYRYHPEWRRRRDVDKFERVVGLARRLPRIREAVERDLSRPGLPREKVLALVVRLLELTHLRVGGEAYRRLNGSHGLTTLTDRQARVEGGAVRFRFRGKGGKQHDVGVEDRRIAGLIRRIQELPGQNLFEYLDASGESHPVQSDDVNEYLREISGLDITAKDFRTWAGTVLAFRALRSEPPAPSQSAGRRQLRAAVTRAADRLGNTPAVTRSSYVDARIIDAWQDGELTRIRVGDPTDLDGPPTPAEEAAVLRVLERREREARRARERTSRGSRQQRRGSGREQTRGSRQDRASGSRSEQASGSRRDPASGSTEAPEGPAKRARTSADGGAPAAMGAQAGVKAT
jgi:DNA topoisomerase-1